MLHLYPLPSPLSGPIFWFRPLCKGVTYVREICYQKSAATIDFHLWGWPATMRVTTPSLSMSIQHVASALCMPTAPSYCPHSLNAKQRNVDATVKVVPSTILHNRPTIRDIYIRPLWEALGGLIAGHPRDLFTINHGSPDRGESKWRANCRTRNCLLGVAVSNIQGHRF